MDDKQRTHIINNVDKLISLTDYKILAHACVAKGLLSSVMLQNLERIEPDLCVNWNEIQKQNERHRRLFIKITKRGPGAFQNLRWILAELKYDSALGTLNDFDDSRVRSLHKPDERYTTMSAMAAATATATVASTLPNFQIPDLNVEEENPISTIITNNERTSEEQPIHLPANRNGNILRDHHNNQQQRNQFGSRNLTNPLVLAEYTDEINPKTKFTVKKSTHIHKHPKLSTYPMQSRTNRGIFFMVNIIDFTTNEEPRRGAEQDAESLLHLYQELGFKLFAYTNLNQVEFFHLLDAILNSDYTLNTECFVMALMTHGTRDDDGFERITFHDGSIAKVEDIEKYFQNHVCRNLQNKPKIFIFPFCRGNIADRGVLEKVQTDSVRYTKISNIPQLSDLLICYAASPGFKAHRDIEAGSWYIQKFVEMMAEYAHDTSFEDIIKMIQAETAKLRTFDGHLQTANSVNMGFNKALYFNPGVWID